MKPHAGPFQLCCRLAFTVFAAGVTAATYLSVAEGSASHSNILFILADDPGFDQIGAYSDTPVQTPIQSAATGIYYPTTGIVGEVFQAARRGRRPLFARTNAPLPARPSLGSKRRCSL